MKLKLKRIFKLLGKITLFFLGLYVLLFILFPLPKLPDYSQCILDKNGEIAYAYLSYDDKWRLFVEEEDISEDLENTILFKEDKWFYWHPGVNPISLLRAAFNNTVAQKTTSGASTITMQIARMLEPKERTVWSKVKEMFRATQLEVKYSKNEILRLYLNLVPYGGNIEGIKSASLFYFNKSPNHLSLSEIVALSIIPNRPESLKPQKENSALLISRNIWLNRLRNSGIFNDTLLSEAIESELIFKLDFHPKEVPHLSRYLHKKHKQNSVETFIDPKIQALLEKQIKSRVQLMNNYGVYNGAGIIVHNPTKKVVAYAGSQDFFDNYNNGQVDGVQAIRQPGSTLKPFIYGRAIDMGIITPKKMLLDVPVNFRGYRPENFDEQFRGKVSAERALAMSLNIPAVSLLNRIGVHELTKLLIRAECKQIQRDAPKLGLSTALGGCGLSLAELAGLYSTLATDGNYSPLRYSEFDDSTEAQTILSPEATYLIHEILNQTDRPDFPLNFNHNYPKIAWKTGTSYGRKDAWCVGYNKDYTVAIWLGNFSGEGRKELTGSGASAPVVFNIFNALDQSSHSSPFTAPKGIRPRYVCQKSGLPVNTYCSSEILDDYIPMVSENRPCDIEQEVFVSEDSTYSYCMNCLPTHECPSMIIDQIPAALAAYMTRELIPFDQAPPHNPNCTVINSAGSLKISNPTAGMEYIIAQTSSDMLSLEVEFPQDAETVQWWMNDKYIGQNFRGEKRFISPPSGKVKISCTDDNGRRDEVTFTVIYN
ncbi:penicillin-binding protein 1C [bacterium]|nr:penicillin-binding protein 1C [bacterium]